MKKRVVVTGMGILAANGNGADAFWNSILKCKSGIAPIRLFDPTDFHIKVAGEVKDFDLAQFVNGHINAKRLGRHTQLALAAAQLAIKHAGLSRDDLIRAEPIAVVVGVSTSAIDVIEGGKERMASLGPKKVSSYVVGACQPNAVASMISAYLAVRTQILTISTACPAGLDAVATAAATLREGRADIAIAGGADAPVNALTVASFGSTGLVPSDVADPARASCPFDRNRGGGVLAEGAGMLVMETLDHALARGATPLVEITGFGSCGDMAEDDPGTGLESAMSMALANAGRLPKDVDYVCAHGPSDPIIDRVETAMVKGALGDHAYKIPVSSIKGVTGNPLAAAGPLQIAACALAMRDGLAPPTANYETPDPACDLDCVPNKPRRMKIRRALVNIHGMGGGNSSVVVEAVAS
ncbi:MAG TPA: beta-ketoacyl-[acyl-carrier-protein] synthase family protein [Kiritimatiellia bacterium]|jgi:3-oxoacyl-(acyl-carrier-protein) synthase